MSGDRKRNTRVKTILVTGAIGSGKSAVCSILADKGFSIYDSDSRAKALYEEIPGLKDRICSSLEIEFDQLGIIFKDENKRIRLEELIYPLLRKDFEQWRDSRQAETVFFESAVAASKTQFNGCFDEIWLVSAPLGVRISRNPKAVLRNSLQDFSALTADEIIVNDGTLEELKTKTEQILWKRQI